MIGAYEMATLTLGAFIQQEIDKRRMSQRQFADLIGVSHQTISRMVSGEREQIEPSLDFLAKLSRATHVDICTLVAMVYPDESNISPRAQLIAQRIERLPAEAQSFIDSYLLGLKGGDDPT